MALVEIHLPNRWQLLSDENDIQVTAWRRTEDGDDKTLVQFNQVLRLDQERGRDMGMVRHLREVLKKIRDKGIRKDAQMTISREGVVTLTLKPQTFVIVPKRVLAFTGINLSEVEIRGDGRCVLGSKDEQTVYRGVADPRGGNHTLWVYSNVCAYRMVGDTRAPLLRPIVVDHAKEASSKVVYRDYIAPHYIPVSQDYFQAIEILITDTEGSPVLFDDGQVVATLHFKRQ